MTHCSHYFGMHIIFLRDQNFIMIYLCDFSHPNEGKGEESKSSPCVRLDSFEAAFSFFFSFSFFFCFHAFQE